MIPTADILHWQQHHAAWTNPAHVEQDLIISRALVELFAAPELAANLAFRGGTALHKLHLAPARRFSEDIDLVQIRPMAIGSVLDLIHGQLDPWLGGPKWKQTQTMCTLTYRFTLDGPTAARARLKVEIYTREAFNVCGTIDYPFEVQSPWFRGASTLKTFTLEELLGTKLRALYQRRKGRDVFDLAHALRHVPDLDRQLVVECFLAYMQREGPAPTRGDFEQNLADKRANPSFMTDMHTLLHPAYGHYDPAAALDEIEREFISRLP